MITVLLRPEDFADRVAADRVAADRVAADRVAADRVKIEGAGYRHLFRARRLRAGAGLRAVDGRGRSRWAVVERVERRLAVLALGAPAPDNEPAYRLHLIIAAPRAARASWLVEKATEIGVRSIRFIATERTPRKYPPASLDRLRRVARAAVEQSHRSRVPEITGVDPWEAVTATLLAGSRPRQSKHSSASGADAGDRYVLDLAGEGSGSWHARGDSGLVLTGPEGGWSRSEVDELEQLGCRSVSLGPRTLRVETAAVVAATRLLL